MASALTIRSQAQRLAEQAIQLGQASTSQKNAALEAAAAALDASRDELRDANATDLADAMAQGRLDGAARDRLTLDDSRIQHMIDGLRALIELPDPIGEIVDRWERPNGLRVSRMRVPLGVVGIIYENRPNVTSDAAGICIKSGNGAFLRGSSTALRSNKVVARAMQAGLLDAGLPGDAVMLVEDVGHDSAVEFMQLRGYIDCLIPRGGPALLDAVLQHATVPYIIDGSGNCHIYVDASADLTEAVSIVVNAKTQRPGVCNAAESLVIAHDIASVFLPMVQQAMPDVAFFADDAASAFLSGARQATEQEFGREFLDLAISVAVVDGVDEAIAHIRRYSSGHTEAILATDQVVIDHFVLSVDAAAVVVNASTRFVDGGELGLGAEIGISTQKLHCRGPMGLRELTTLKYVVEGNGQVR